MYIKPSKTVKQRFKIRLSQIIPLIFLLICIPIFNVWGTTETNSFKAEGFMKDSGDEINDRITSENGLVYLPEFTEFTSMAAVKVSTNVTAPKELTNVIDKVRMAALDNSYYGEWTASYGENGELINTSTGQAGKFHSGASFRLELDWSTKGENLSAGDYFTFRIPKGFIDTKYIKNQSSGALYEDADNDSTPVVAHYTIEVLNDSVNFDNDVLITFTFTEYVYDKNKIVGDFWLMCYAQNFDGTDEKGESKAVEFEINADGSLQTFSFDVTVLPPRPAAEWEPSNYNYIKYGSCSPSYILDGFYYFRWEMYINMDFNTNTPVVDHFKIEDVIPSDSPHKFISPADNDGFGEQKNIHRILIREYIGADEDVYDTPEKRYTKLKADYNADDSENWIYKCFRWNGNAGYFLPDCEGLQVLTGVDGDEGINVTGFANPSSDASYISADRKALSIDLGRVTRPTIISYCTIAEIELEEQSLANSGTVSAFVNSVRFYSEGEDTDFGEDSAKVQEYSFSAGGGGTGSVYDKEFSFTKTDKTGKALQGARFLLYGNAECTGIVYGMAISDWSGQVRFAKLKAGLYYMKEDSAPSGYVANNTVYMVKLSASGADMFCGDGFDLLLNEPVKIENNAIDDTGDLLIKKIDGSTGNDIMGAVFEIYDGEMLIKTVTVGGDGTVEWHTTDPSESGYWLISGLEPWKEYKIKEIIPPDGYLLSETEDDVTVTVYITGDQTKDTIPKLIFINYTPETSPDTSRLKLIKNDNLGKPLNGAVFEIYTKTEFKTLVATADMSNTSE